MSHGRQVRSSARLEEYGDALGRHGRDYAQRIQTASDTMTQLIDDLLHPTLEEQVQQRTAHLETANQNLASFTNTVAHDLRTPLRAISGYAEILTAEYGDRIDETGRSYARHI